jgi:SAM-dependent methyltransferase
VSLLYEAAYRLRYTPWESRHPAVAELVTAGLDREERDRRPPLGAALDLGCGTGRWTIELARRGWDAVGVDNVAVAVRRARRRAATAAAPGTGAGGGARFVHGDVTALADCGVTPGIDLVLDVGCFDTLGDPRRAAMGASVTAAAAPGATLLAVLWAPPHGASSGEDLGRAYPGWDVLDEDATGDGPRTVRLRRR